MSHHTHPSLFPVILILMNYLVFFYFEREGFIYYMPVDNKL